MACSSYNEDGFAIVRGHFVFYLTRDSPKMVAGSFLGVNIIPNITQCVETFTLLTISRVPCWTTYFLDLRVDTGNLLVSTLHLMTAVEEIFATVGVAPK